MLKILAGGGGLLGIAGLILTLLVWLPRWQRAQAESASRDAKVRRALVGTWTREGGGQASFGADGSFSSAWTNFQSKPVMAWTYGGSWEITNGACLIILTKKGSWNATNSQVVGSTERWKILRLDNTNLVWELDGQRVSLVRRN